MRSRYDSNRWSEFAEIDGCLYLVIAKKSASGDDVRGIGYINRDIAYIDGAEPSYHPEWGRCVQRLRWTMQDSKWRGYWEWEADSDSRGGTLWQEADWVDDEVRI